MTLNPRTEFFSHRAKIEAFVTQPAGGEGGGETTLDALLSTIGIALAAGRSLNSLAENLYLRAPEASVLAIKGAAPMDAFFSLSVNKFIVENRFEMLNRGHRHDEPVHFGTFERTGDKSDHSSSSSKKNEKER